MNTRLVRLVISGFSLEQCSFIISDHLFAAEKQKCVCVCVCVCVCEDRCLCIQTAQGPFCVCMTLKKDVPPRYFFLQQ